MLISLARPEGRGPLNMASDGIKIGADLDAVRTGGLAPDATPSATTSAKDVIDIRIYLDYMCANCGVFEKKNVDQLEAWVKSGAATVEIHPIALLTTKSAGSQYSLRAANAAACVSEFSPDSFFDFNTALFRDQPQEGTPGWDDSQLVSRARSAGVSHLGSIKDCIQDRRFVNWVQAATVRALNGPIPDSDVRAIATAPTIIVNGKQFKYSSDFDPNELAQFVLQAMGQTYNDTATSSPSPSPTPSATPNG